MSTFQRVLCPCGAVLLESAAFSGLVRLKCEAKGCKRRLWVAGDGTRAIIALIDRAPRRRVA